MAPLLKWGLYLAAWMIVAFETFLKNPRSLQQAHAFPIGLLGVLAVNSKGREAAIVGAWLGGFVMIIAGWGLYLVLTVLIARTKKPATFFLYYIILCAVLALNISGCKALTETAAGIQ